MTVMVQKAEWRKENMERALKKDFSNATDLADDLVEKGMSFREAHEVVGALVRWCIDNGKGIEDMSLAELQTQHKSFDKVSLAKVSHRAVMNARKSRGGTSPEMVRDQISRAKKLLV